MLRFTGWIFILGGGAIVLVSLYRALMPLVTFYSQTLSDPMADAGEGRDLSGIMLRQIGLGLLGAVLLVIGTAIVKVLAARRLARRLSRMSAMPRT
jgi:hypothetical protein